MSFSNSVAVCIDDEPQLLRPLLKLNGLQQRWQVVALDSLCPDTDTVDDDDGDDGGDEEEAGFDASLHAVLDDSTTVVAVDWHFSFSTNDWPGVSTAPVCLPCVDACTVVEIVCCLMGRSCVDLSVQVFWLLLKPISAVLRRPTHHRIPHYAFTRVFLWLFRFVFAGCFVLPRCLSFDGGCVSVASAGVCHVHAGHAARCKEHAWRCSRQ